MLASIKPKKEPLKLTQAVFEDVWNNKTNEAEKRSKKDIKRLVEIDEEVESLLGLITKSKSETAIKMYEKRLENLEKEKSILEQGKNSSQWTSEHFQTALETVLSFVKKPYIFWKSGNLDTKKQF